MRPDGVVVSLGSTARGTRAVWLCAALVLILAGLTAWIVAPLSPSVLMLQFAWTPRGFGEIVHVWPPEHLARYRAHLPVDCALLLAYAAFGHLLATRTRILFPLARPVRRFAPFMLPLAAAFDAAENAFHAWLTAMPRFDVPLVYLASTASSASKWALLFAFAAILLCALARGED